MHDSYQLLLYEEEQAELLTNVTIWTEYYRDVSNLKFIDNL